MFFFFFFKTISELSVVSCREPSRTIQRTARLKVPWTRSPGPWLSSWENTVSARTTWTRRSFWPVWARSLGRTPKNRDRSWNASRWADLQVLLTVGRGKRNVVVRVVHRSSVGLIIPTEYTFKPYLVFPVLYSWWWRPVMDARRGPATVRLGRKFIRFGRPYRRTRLNFDTTSLGHCVVSAVVSTAQPFCRPSQIKKCTLKRTPTIRVIRRAWRGELFQRYQRTSFEQF